MNEHGFTKWIHRTLPKEVYHWKIHDSYAGGVPDAWYSGNGGDLFVEYKWIASFPKRDNTIIDMTHEQYLSRLQQNWLRNRHEEGRAVSVIAGFESRAIIFTGCEWMEPRRAAEFRDLSVERREVINFITAKCGGDPL